MSTTAVCANCDRQADIAYEPVAGSITNFCKKHLPRFLQRPGVEHLIKDLELERVLTSGEVVTEELTKAGRKKASESASEEKEAQ